MTADNELAKTLQARIAFVDGHADIWALFLDGELFAEVVSALAAPLEGKNVTKVAGVEARGFILGAAVATRLKAGFVAIRKADGLYPGPKVTAISAADYRGKTHTLRLQRGACGPGDRIAVVDDWFETGSQGRAARELIERSGATYVGTSIIVTQLSDTASRTLAPCHALVAARELRQPR